MPTEGSRRAFLAAVGASALSFVSTERSSATPTPTPEPCDAVAERKAEIQEKQARLDALRAERETIAERIEGLRTEIPAVRTDWIETQHEHDPETRARARITGLDARPGVVVVELLDQTGSTSGTGWFIDDGLIVTNSHVVTDWERATETRGWSLEGERFPLDLVGRVEGTSPDVALLRTDFDGPALPTGSSDPLDPDTPLVAVGHPGNFGNWVTTLGVFKGVNANNEEEFVTDVPSLEGNSGSPTMTLDGQVVGMLKGTGGTSSGDEAPTPADPTVYTGVITPEEPVLHDSIEAVKDQVAQWT